MDSKQPPLLPPMSPPSFDSSTFLGGLPLLGQDPSLDPLVAHNQTLSPMTSTFDYPDLPPLPSFESSSAYPADLSSLQQQLLQKRAPLEIATSGSNSAKAQGKARSKQSTTKKTKANVKVVARGKKTTTATGTGTGKKRGTYNSYKDEAGQQRAKQAIETFLERRRKNSNVSLRAFATEVDIKYETLKPYCRADESKRKKFVVKGQRRLVPEADMDSFCRRMVREQPTLDRAYIINAFLVQFSHLKLDRKAACNQYDRSIKKKCEAIQEEEGNKKKPPALPDTSLPIKKRKRREEKQEEGDLSMNSYYASFYMVGLKEEENVDDETGCTTTTVEL